MKLFPFQATCSLHTFYGLPCTKALKRPLLSCKYKGTKRRCFVFTYMVEAYRAMTPCNCMLIYTWISNRKYSTDSGKVPEYEDIELHYRFLPKCIPFSLQSPWQQLY